MKTLIAVIALWLATVGPVSSALAADAPVAAADTTASASSAPAGDAKSATLRVFNRPIFVFRQPFLGVPPAERAALARERIYSLLERGGPGTVTSGEIAQGRIVSIDGSYAFVISHNDVPAGGGDSMDIVAARTVAALEQAIAETREARDVRLLTNAAIHSAIATAIFVALIYGLFRLGRVLTKRTLRLTHRLSSHLRVGGTAVVQRRRAFHLVAFVLRACGWLLFLLVTYEWVGYVLARFPYTRAWGEQLNAFLLNTATKIVLGIATSIPELLIAAVVFAIAHSINRMQRTFFDNVEQGRVRVGWVDRDTAKPTRKLLSIAVWVFALVMAYPYIPGSDTDAFKGLSVLLGLMVSVGASGLVGQAASGLILMYTRTFRVGEYVRIGDAEGTVVQMGMFTTHVRNGMGVEMTLPNSTVMGAVTRNFSRPAQGGGFVLTAAVTIGYDVPWRQVEGLLLAAAQKAHGVLDSPAPRVYVHALSDFYIEYTLVCQGNDKDPQMRAGALSGLNAAIVDEFNVHGVQIMSPHYLGDPAHEKVVPPADWYKAPATPPRG
jgi:small-conductance mechanosensitive channel